MAKNITLMGASYTAVPAVQLPKTGGGTARFDDASVTTAIASDVASGKVFLLADGTIATGTNSGGAVLSVNLSESGVLPNVTLTPNKTYAQAKEVLDNGGALILSDGDGYNQFNYSYDYYEDEIDIYYNVLSADDYSYSCIFAWTSSGITRLTELTLIPEPTESKIITQNGIHDVKLYATATVSVSGGASNFVTGTFTGTTAQKGTAIDIDIPYTGSGYPVSIVIYPSDGPYNSDSTFYNLIQRHACCYLVGIKSIPNATPTYSSSTSNNNNMMVGYQYRKNSTSSATTYAGVATTGYAVYLNSIATPNNTLGIARFKSATRLSVFIADTSYGFAAGIEYTYQVAYSE